MQNEYTHEGLKGSVGRGAEQSECAHLGFMGSVGRVLECRSRFEFERYCTCGCMRESPKTFSPSGSSIFR